MSTVSKLYFDLVASSELARAAAFRPSGHRGVTWATIGLGRRSPDLTVSDRNSSSLAISGGAGDRYKKTRALLGLALGLAFGVPAAAQTTIRPDCVLDFNFTAAGQTSGGAGTCGDNVAGVVQWTLWYKSTGFSAISLRVESASDNNGVPGSWGAYAGAVNSGVNPNTSTTQAQTTFTAFEPWVRVVLTSKTGTGRVTGELYGCRQPGCSGGLAVSVAPSGPAGGDLCGAYPDPTVCKVNGTPYGASPLAHQVPIRGVYHTIANCPADAVSFDQSTDTFGCNVIPTSLPPSGAAGGDLCGMYPNPTLCKIAAAMANQAIVVDASKNVGSVAYGTPSAASSLVERDANQNAFANNFVSKWTNVVSAGMTSLLTAASTRCQNLTGSANQTFQLPDATTLQVGASFCFNNSSTGTLTVTDNGANVITAVPSGGLTYVIAIAVVTSNGSWDFHSWTPSVTKWGTSGIQNTGPTNNSAMTFGLTTQTNTCNPTSDYQLGQGGLGVNFAAEGFAGCVNIAAGSTNLGAVGVQGSAQNASTTTNAVGGYFPSFASGNGSGTADAQRVRLWGINPLADDQSHTNVLLTNEFDFNVHAAGTKLLGLQLTGAGTQDMSSDSAGVIVGPIGTTHKWPTDFYCADGSASICLNVGSAASGSSQDSQVVRLVSHSSGGVVQTLDIKYLQGGGYQFDSSSAAGGIFFKRAGVTYLTINSDGGIVPGGVAFAALGTPGNGAMIYCTDCKVTSAVDNTCVAAGTGAYAFRLNGAFKCFQ